MELAEALILWLSNPVNRNDPTSLPIGAVVLVLAVFALAIYLMKEKGG